MHGENIFATGIETCEMFVAPGRCKRRCEKTMNLASQSRAWMDASLLRHIFSCDSPKLLNQHGAHVLLRPRLFAQVKRLKSQLRSNERNFETT